MQLMRLADVPLLADDRVFLHSKWRALLGSSVAVLAAIGSALFAKLESAPPFYAFAVLILLGVAVMRRLVLARFRPSNWLARLGHEGLFLQFRSYLNHHLPSEDRTVVFIPFRAIRSLRVVRERRLLSGSRSPRHRGNVTEKRRTLVEVELSSDCSALAQALAAERGRSAPRQARGYGSTSVLYRHYPARMARPDCLEIEWGVVPPAQQLCDALTRAAPHIESSREPLRTRSYLDLGGLEPEEQDERLRELVETGESLAAIRLLRQLHGCDLAEAKRRVEALRSDLKPALPERS